MWRRHAQYPAAGVHRLCLDGPDGAVRFDQVLRLWHDDPAFREFWIDTLRRVPFDAYCWELPPLTRDRLDRPFECVFVDNPALAATHADPAPFAEHFEAAPDAAILTVDNLGGDARLVVPCPQTEISVYSHLAEFARRGPTAQVRALWPAVAAALDRRLGRRPVWLSTAGLGVYWLHVRLDDRPKYYRFRAYTQAPD